MNKTGPVIFIEDDADDQEVFVSVFTRLGYHNDVLFFSDGKEALDFLRKRETHPFLIISDINMPKMNGFELRNMIYRNEQLMSEYIPYLFFTTAANKELISEAYAMSVQGFFVKPDSIADWELTLKRIMEYWGSCTAPGHPTS